MLMTIAKFCDRALPFGYVAVAIAFALLTGLALLRVWQWSSW